MDKEILKKIGFNIKLQRMKQNLTQANLAEMINAHEKYISRIETGKQNVTINTLYKLSTALNIGMYKLLNFDLLNLLDKEIK